MADPGFKFDLMAGTRVPDVRPRVDYPLTGNLGPIALPEGLSFNGPQIAAVFRW